MRVRRRIQGLSLIELAVTSTLLLIVLSLSYLAMVSGTQTYLSIRSSIDLQQSALKLLTRMSTEGTEAHAATIWPVPVAGAPLTPPAGEPNGVVFASARDANGDIHFDSTSMQPLWQKRIAYWFDPANKRLFRGVDELATPQLTPPLADPNFGTGYFRDSVNGIAFQGTVEKFDLRTSPDGNSLHFEVEFSEENRNVTRKLEFVGNATPRG